MGQKKTKPKEPVEPVDPEQPEPPPPPASRSEIYWNFTKTYWKALFSVIWPIIWCPVLFLNFHDKAYRCLYLVLVMAGYWVTECIPLAISSTLPIVYLPAMSIVPTAIVTKEYMNKTNVMFIGGIMVALAVEHSRLHYRIALGFILLIGCSPRRLHFGIMTITMFISWWMSNTAATAMMCPIIKAVLEELEKQGMGSLYKPLSEEEQQLPEAEKQAKRVPTDSTLAYFLAAAYSSTIGGCATIVGTGTNLTYVGLFEGHEEDLKEKVKNDTSSYWYDYKPKGVNFALWIAFNGPIMFIINCLTFLILEMMYLGLFRKNSEGYKMVQKGKELKSTARTILKQKYNDLGTITWHESWVLFFFLLCIILWFFLEPGFMPGYGKAISSVKINDGSVAFFIIILMFLVPAKPTFLKACTSDRTKWPQKSEPLITWKLLHQKTPWGLMFLLGGGFALALGSKQSGMNDMIGDWLSVMKVLPDWVIMGTIATIASFMTELSANVAICNIVVPICLSLSENLKIDPQFLALPTAIACSFSFMLPVGTPPNAVAAGFVNIPTPQMAKCGIIVSVMAMFVYILAVMTYGKLIYKW
ncbi:protein I'm not dead yet-like [Chrysoperla carnea]|uniref:protein I'm not dead yet-like n=1 Tax=Chrysoperla carnea TaxID=189513 RepID=UPI001D089ED2|nr:protein I'm not dead yet-like [Chrysoperla carnea]